MVRGSNPTTENMNYEKIFDKSVANAMANANVEMSINNNT